jgi:hypothetical protein
MKKMIFLCALLTGCNGGSDSNKLAEVHINQAIDILFVIDNGGDMAREQEQLGESIDEFLFELERNLSDDYHVGVVTTGIETHSCPLCDQYISKGCVNESGEGGRLQDRMGKYQYVGEEAVYSSEYDQTCRMVDKLNKICLFDEVERKGTLLVGDNGCGFEWAFAAMKMALGVHPDDYNSGFLRDEATLAVVILSSEDDCGEVDEVFELTSDGGNVCFFAAKGEGPEPGNSTYTPMTYHPGDPEERPYQLTAVEEYKTFLENLKGGKFGMIKFAAIVGVEHVNDLDTTTIEYEWDVDRGRWMVVEACTTTGCTGDYCNVRPGTRYIQMAEMFGIGENGFIDTVCQMDYTGTMERLARFLSCPGRFLLEKDISDPQKSNLELNGQLIPRFSCTVANQLESCQYTDDPSCSVGTCVETWTYFYPSLAEPHGSVVFAEHFDACSYAEGGVLRIDLAK